MAADNGGDARSSAGDVTPEAACQAFRLEFVPWTWERFAEVADLRYAVLQEPFGVVRMDDWDDGDPASEHLVALAPDGAVLGYSRLIMGREDAQIRQVCVEPSTQRSGVGSALVQALVGRALERGAREVWLNARVPALAFYERIGFAAVGEPFATGRTSIPHMRMEYRGFGE